jgi:DNA topoisomerase-2
MAIVGLKLGHDDIGIKDLRFGKLIIAADFDPDGGHVCGLIVNMFQQFWPNLIKEGFLYRLRTPLIIVTMGKQTKEFFSRNEYQQWNQTAPKHSMKYYKGLGSFDTKTFKKYMNDPTYHCNLVYNDESDFRCIDLAFDRSKANDRKEWLLED